MTLQEFQGSTAREHPPPGLCRELLSLWFDRKGDWERAHSTAQDIDTPAGSRIHAYLHRKEGDAGNARYWYARAGRPEFSGSLEDEWLQLVRSFLKGGSSGGSRVARTTENGHH